MKFMIQEAMSVFWQTLKDVWEELYSLGMVNLVWVFSFLPMTLIAEVPSIYLAIPLTLITLVAVPLATVGIYYVTRRVAQGKTFHFSDFIEGVKLHWWRSLIWVLVNAVVLYLIYTNLIFYPNIVHSPAVLALIGGLWIAAAGFWLAIQIYYWPMLLSQEKPNMLLAWKNAAFLFLANPFYGFFIVCFTLVLAVVCAGLVLPFIFVGMAIVALLGNNAAQTLLVALKVIEDPRPKPMGR